MGNAHHCIQDHKGLLSSLSDLWLVLGPRPQLMSSILCLMPCEIWAPSFKFACCSDSCIQDCSFHIGQDVIYLIQTRAVFQGTVICDSFCLGPGEMKFSSVMAARGCLCYRWTLVVGLWSEDNDRLQMFPCEFAIYFYCICVALPGSVILLKCSHHVGRESLRRLLW